MLQQMVRLRVSMTVNEGQMDSFKHVAREMTEATESEPDALGYEWFAGPAQNVFTLLETYLNAAAVEKHFTGPVVQQLVPKLAAVVSIRAFEIYGDPGSIVAGMARGFGAEIYPYWTGLRR